MSLRSRLALVVGITVLTATVIGGLGTAISSRNVGRDRVDEALRNDAQLFRSDSPRLGAQLQFAFDARRAACDEEGAAQAEDDSAAAEEVEADLAPDDRRPGGRRLQFLPEFESTMQLLRPNGTAVAACQTLPISDADTDIAQDETGSAFRTVSIEGERFRVLTWGYEDIGAVQYARSLEITEDTLRGLLARSLLFGLLGAALASALGWLVATRATNPVKRLSATAERVAKTQDLGERIEIESDDEIGVLASSFNTMLSSLDTSREQQQRLVQDASHELRTPLTSLRTNVDLLLRHDDLDPAIRHQVLGDIGTELNELTALTTELVESATEVPTTITVADDVDLFDLVNECVDRAQRRHRRDIDITVAATRDTVVTGDVTLLGRAVTNLINNAVKFSDDAIEVEVGKRSVTVRDRGPGIPDEDLPHVFERFYRATAARSSPGSGLGLAIVKQIVEGHGGQVHAMNRQADGASIGFSLPQGLTAASAEPD